MIATHRAKPALLSRYGAGFPPGPGGAFDRVAGVKLAIQNVNFWYGAHQALFDVTLPIAGQSVTALIGPSGCGKSTLLRLMNRLHESADGVRWTGAILLDGEDICRPRLNVVDLRRRVGMVFQKSNPFPMTIYDNVAFGPRSGGIRDRRRLDTVVERCLTQVGLWDEVRDRLGGSAMELSGGQQQRLCIARSLATDPEVLLMDEPASALDPKSTQTVEDLIQDLKRNYTIVLVTHNMQQAARVADVTAFFFEGRLIECGLTAQIFGNPSEPKTEEYITGRFG